MNDIETTFVQTFIARDKRERWLSGLSSEKHRRKLLNRLPHVFDNDLDPRFVHDEDNMAPTVAVAVGKVLREWKKANPDQLCYLISPQTERDKQMIKLPDVETDYLLTFGAIIIVVADRLVYYRTERSNIDKQPFYVLFKPEIEEHGNNLNSP